MFFNKKLTCILIVLISLTTSYLQGGSGSSAPQSSVYNSSQIGMPPIHVEFYNKAGKAHSKSVLVGPEHTESVSGCYDRIMARVKGTESIVTNEALQPICPYSSPEFQVELLRTDNKYVLRTYYKKHVKEVTLNDAEIAQL